MDKFQFSEQKVCLYSLLSTISEGRGKRIILLSGLTNDPSLSADDFTHFSGPSEITNRIKFAEAFFGAFQKTSLSSLSPPPPAPSISREQSCNKIFISNFIADFYDQVIFYKDRTHFSPLFIDFLGMQLPPPQ